MNRRIALDTAMVLGFSLFLLGLSGFYVQFIGPGHGDFAICGTGVQTSCWENVWGPIFMFLFLFGGAALAGIGGLRRKTAKLNLWESVLLGFLVILIFDLFNLPTIVYFVLYKDSASGGQLIFALFLTSLVGIVFSAFKYIQTSNGVSSDETRPKLMILATPKRKKMYGLILIVGLMLAVSVFLAPWIVYGGGSNLCFVGITPGRLSYQISNYSQHVGPPLYSKEQFLLTPGSTSYLTYDYNATGYGYNYNISQWFARDRWTNQSWSPERVNPLTGETYSTTVNQSGVSLTFQNLSYHGSYVALILYKITISRFAPSATYGIAGWCSPDLLLTIGYVPYWGPLPFGLIQLMALPVNVAISLIGSSLLITILRIRYSSIKIDDKENTLQRDQHTQQYGHHQVHPLLHPSEE